MCSEAHLPSISTVQAWRQHQQTMQNVSKVLKPPLIPTVFCEEFLLLYLFTNTYNSLKGKSLSRGGLWAPESQSLGLRQGSEPPWTGVPEPPWGVGAGVEWPHVQGEIVNDSAKELFSSWSLNSQEKFASPRGSQSAILRLAEGGGSRTPLLSGSRCPAASGLAKEKG